MFIKKTRAVSYYLTTLCFGIWFTYQINEIKIITPDKVYQKIPALIQGKIVKTIKVSKTRATFIVQGDFDGQALPYLKNQRILLTIFGLKYRPMKLETGMSIFADVTANTPRKPQLTTDFPENDFAASLDVKWIASTSSRFVAILNTPSGFLNFKDKQVKAIQERINLLFPENSSPIVTALLTGDKTKLSNETKKLFSYSGTAHVLAVSGLHVGIIATIVFFLLGFIRNNWLKFLIFSFLIISFVILSGMQASALRAGLMAILFVYSKTLQRHANPLNIISIAILLLLIIYPEMLYSAGFQMSVSAIIGIILLFQPIRKFFQTIIKHENIIVNFIISSLAITLSASIIVAPLVAYYFKVYSVVSPLANLLVIPLMTLGMSFSIIALLLSYIYFPIASIYALSADYLISLSQRINEWAVELPHSYLIGDNLIFPAVLISFAIVYITLSSNIKQICFRLSYAVIVVLFVYFLFPERAINEVKIYPREQYVAIELPNFRDQKSFVLIDRKPRQKPLRDFPMFNYLKDIKQPAKLYYSGNAGLSIVDDLKKSSHFKSFEMDLDFQREVQKLLNIKEEIPQIINLEY
ncbi:MAG: ComEC/Rec2 family competence protein [bacterium]